MPYVSIVFGLLLVGVGLWGWGSADWQPKAATAMIPAAFGALLLVLGAVALVERFLKHAMHAAAVVGLLGLIGGAVNLFRVGVGEEALRSHKGISTLLLIGLSAAFVALCVNSFIQARRRRRAREAAAQV